MGIRQTEVYNMAAMKTFNSPTLVRIQQTKYWVIGVCDDWGGAPAIRLQPVGSGSRIVVTKNDHEWDEVVIVEDTQTLTA